MAYAWIEKCALEHKGAQADTKLEWEARRFLLKGKMSGMLAEHKDGRPILSLKREPAHSEWLCKQYADSIPEYYPNKDHWSSMYLDNGAVPRQLREQRIHEAYTRVLRSLPKKVQAEISGTGKEAKG